MDQRLQRELRRAGRTITVHDLDHLGEKDLLTEVVRRKAVWGTHDRRLIKVVDLRDDHLVNILRCYHGHGQRKLRNSRFNLSPGVRRWPKVSIKEVLELEAERRGLPSKLYTDPNPLVISDLLPEAYSDPQPE